MHILLNWWPTSTGISRDSCRSQGHHKKDTSWVYFIPVPFLSNVKGFISNFLLLLKNVGIAHVKIFLRIVSLKRKLFSLFMRIGIISKTVSPSTQLSLQTIYLQHLFTLSNIARKCCPQNVKRRLFLSLNSESQLWFSKGKHTTKTHFTVGILYPSGII